MEKEHKKIEVAVLPLTPKISPTVLVGIMVAVMMVVSIFAMLGDIIHEYYQVKTAREKVVNAFTSGNIEQDLNQLNTPITISKSRDKTNYSFKISTSRLYGLTSPRIQFYEIETSQTSQTLTIKNHRLEGIDYKMDLYKEMLKGVKIAEIKTLPNLKTGAMDISFKIED